MTLVDKAALTAALGERDAARAEVARLRAAVAELDAMVGNWRHGDGRLCYVSLGQWTVHRGWDHERGKPQLCDRAHDGSDTTYAATEDQP